MNRNKGKSEGREAEIRKKTESRKPKLYSRSQKCIGLLRRESLVPGRGPRWSRTVAVL